jgi:hypothetical protein
VAIFAQHFQLVDVLHEKPFAEPRKVFICLEASQWNFVIHLYALFVKHTFTIGA